MKIKQYAAVYLVLFLVLFSEDLKKTFASQNLFLANQILAPQNLHHNKSS